MRTLLLPLMMFLVATLFYLYEFVLRVAPTSIFDYLMQDFQIDASALGGLSSIYFFSYALLQLPIGALTDRFGPKRLLTFAILLCAVSTLIFAVTTSYFWVCIARLFIGAGSAFAFISCMKINTVWFHPRLFPMLTGITLTIGTLGGAIGEVPISFALDFLSWRDLMWGLGWVGVILAVFAWLCIKDKNDNGHHEAYHEVYVWRSFKEVIRSKQNWLVALYGFMVTAPTDAFAGMWGIPYLVQARGFEREIAASVCSAIFVGLAVGSPIFGMLGNQMKSRRLPAFLGSLGALLSCLGIIYAPTLTPMWAAALFFLFGFFSSYVLAFVIIRDIMPPKLVGTAVGFVNMASMLGSFLLMYLIGVFLDCLWAGDMVNGIHFYDRQAYQYALLGIPLCYLVNLFVLLPLIHESFRKNGAE